jgi:antitoxin YefM
MGFPTRLENTEMNVLTFSEARASLKQAMDKVCDDHQPTVITRQRGEHVVMMSLADFDSWQETIYLLSSPKNAQHLMESIAQLKAGRIRTLELTDNETKRPQQTSS